jgi:hypothetical protein
VTRTRFPALAALITLASLGAPARAEDAPAQRAFQAALTNAKDSAEMVISGAAPDLPDGTVLHVTLSVAGNFPVPIEAAFFQVKVHEGKYDGRWPFRGKTLAPLAYWARADLLMSQQPKAIRESLRKQHGWGFEHREQISQQSIVVGTPEEGVQFRKETLTRLREFVVRTQALREKAGQVVAQPAGGNAEWAAAEKAFYAELKTCLGDLRAFLAPRVVWHEQRLIEEVQNAHNELTRAIQSHGKGQAGAADRVSRVGDFLATVLANIDGRLPSGEMPFAVPERGKKDEPAPQPEQPAPREGNGVNVQTPGGK